MSVRMSDVALQAGVSVSTVSKVLSGNGASMQLNEVTIARVQRAAEQLRYVPNAVARDLRAKRSNRVGVLLSGYQDRGIPLEVRLTLEGGLLFGLTHALRELGLPALTVYPADPNAAPDPRDFLDGRVDGLIVQSDPRGLNLLETLQARGLPIVGVWTREVGATAGYVDVDHRGGARLATEHLIEGGHRRIAFLGPVGPLGQQENFRLRREGFDAAITAAGLEPALTFAEPEALVAALHSASAPSAVFVVNDRRTKPLLECLQRAGMRVPDDLSVASFDNVIGSDWLAGGLTTVENPVQLVGETALKHLVALIGGADPLECRTVLPTKLVVRQSTAAISEGHS